MGFVEKKDDMVSLSYIFLFNKSANIWNHLYQFEADLADFFGANKLEAKVVSIIGGNNGDRIMFIKKVEDAETLANLKGTNPQMHRLLPKQQAPQKTSTMVKSLSASLAKSLRKVK